MTNNNPLANDNFGGSTSSRLERLLGAATVAILILLPLNGIWWRSAQLFGFQGSILEWIEIAVLLLLAMGCVYLGYRRRYFFSWKIADLFLLAYLLIAGLSYLWSNQTLTEHIMGLRYSALLFVFYFVARVLGRSDDWIRGVRWVLAAVAIIAISQLTLWWIMPETRSWLLLATDSFVGEFPRLQGSFAGPNQLATFLALGWLGVVAFDRTKKNSVISTVFLTVLLLVTFSRSAGLGLIGGLIAATLLLPEYRKQAVTQIGVIAVVSVILISLSGILSGESPISSIFRTVSDRGHLQSPQVAVRAIFDAEPMALIFGHGAGTSGPATLSWFKSVISENWFLQTAFEYGLFGLLAVLGFFSAVLWRAYRYRQPGLLAMTVALIVNSFFLHPLSDNAAATLLFFIGAGSILTLPDWKPEGDSAKIETKS